eukprot:gene4346-14462_t
MLPLVKQSIGWEYINEGTEDKPKKGFVSTTPGSSLKMTIDTSRIGDGGSIPVMIGYLKSYTSMGQAMLE